MYQIGFVCFIYKVCELLGLITQYEGDVFADGCFLPGHTEISGLALVDELRDAYPSVFSENQQLSFGYSAKGGLRIDLAGIHVVATVATKDPTMFLATMRIAKTKISLTNIGEDGAIVVISPKEMPEVTPRYRALVELLYRPIRETQPLHELAQIGS